MSNLFKAISKVINVSKVSPNNYKNKDDLYLAASTDLVDLERRQKELDTRFTRKL